MANFLMSKTTREAHVAQGAHGDPDFPRTATAAVRRGPIAEIAASNDVIVVTNHADDSISLLNPETFAVECDIAVDGEPFAAIASDDRVYISTAAASHDAVAVIDTSTTSVIASYPLALLVTALAISPDGKRVYAGRTANDHVDVAVIDTTAERVGTIDIATGAGIGVDAIAVDPAGKRLFVATTDARGSQLVVVDAETTRLERKLWVGAPIRDLAFVDGTAYVLTSDRTRGGAISVVDLSTNRITDTIELGIGAPTQMALSADKTRAYVVDYDGVAVVDTQSHEVVNTLAVDARPSCVALNSDGSMLYVADYAGGVTAFTVASTMPLLHSQFMATDPIALPQPRALEIA